MLARDERRDTCTGRTSLYRNMEVGFAMDPILLTIPTRESSPICARMQPSLGSYRGKIAVRSQEDARECH